MDIVLKSIYSYEENKIIQVCMTFKLKKKENDQE